MPILVWGTFSASAGILLAVPAVSLPSFCSGSTGTFGTHFFSGTDGGQPLLWQHLFWIFAHPWVYIIVLPAMGLVSDALPILCRRPIVGYGLVAGATVATMVIGFGVWAHHMFATGLPAIASAYFSAASFIIAIPSAVATFAWIATIWSGRPLFTTAFLYFAGFIVMFVIGGVSGVVTAAAAGRPATHRHLFRRRAPPLRADRHQLLRRAGRALFLVPQDDRTDARRAAGPLEFLDHLHRLQRRLPADAYHRPDGDAAARLYLSRRARASTSST